LPVFSPWVFFEVSPETSPRSLLAFARVALGPSFPFAGEIFSFVSESFFLRHFLAFFFSPPRPQPRLFFFVHRFCPLLVLFLFFVMVRQRGRRPRTTTRHRRHQWFPSFSFTLRYLFQPLPFPPTLPCPVPHDFFPDAARF